ncbi:CHAT domain-containing protein [Amycolatopsis sp. WGS_07]|uniref:CHAT domain-containing protein n=1 Tax=Amycolatopsis sp. WGS_07 TaxID=3076764 RepID=UPI00387386E1
MRESLAALHFRLAAFDRGDVSPVLDGQALSEAQRVLDGLGTVGEQAQWAAVAAVARLHWARYRAGAGDHDLRLAIGLFDSLQRVDPSLVPGEVRESGVLPDGPEIWAQQASAMLERARDRADPQALDEPVRLLRAAVAAGHPERAICLADLSVMLHVRFGKSRETTDLDASIAAIEEALAAGDPLYAVPFLDRLGRLRFERFDLLGEVPDIDAAVSAFTSAVEATFSDDPALADRLTGLGTAFAARYRRLGRPADVDAGVEWCRRAAEHAPPGHPSFAVCRSHLGIALALRYADRGDPADLDAAVAAGQDAVEAVAETDAARPAFLLNLGDWVRQRFERSGEQADLDFAVSVLRESAATAYPGSPEHGRGLANLAIALRTRYDRLGRRSDIDDAIAAGRQALAGTSVDDPELPRRLSSLSVALVARFEQTGERADLDDAVSVGRAAIESTPPDDRERASRLDSLASALLTRFERFGDEADLDTALATVRTAADGFPAGSTGRPAVLHNLGLAAMARFERYGELSDVDTAVAAAREAVAGVAATDHERPIYLTQLGTVLRTRSERFNRPADLDSAFDAAREAVETVPAEHADRPLCLAMYALVARARFDRSGDLADLDAGIAANRQALEALPEQRPNWAIYSANLGSALRARFDRSGDPADLDDAVEAARNATAAVSPDHPYRARFRLILGRALRTRFETSGEPADAEAALDSYREASAVLAAPVAVRMQAGRERAELAAAQGRWAVAAEGYTQVVELLPLRAWLGASRRSRERWLADWRGLAADAAACAIAAGQPGRALELLEAGRGVLWSQALETRSDLTVLRQAHPGLAARLDAVRAVMEGTGADLSSALPAREADARMAAARDWNALLGEIRTLPGFGDFARLPSARQLQTAASGGTVVVVNVSKWRCDALLITESAIEPLPLPSLTEDEVAARVGAYLDALHEPDAGGAATEETITRTLGWLWETIARPVLRALGHVPSENGPRLWWCPTGALTLVPLHAAGQHSEPGESVLDHVVSSYTPSLRALSAARSRPAEEGKLLLVALAETPGAEPLPGAEQELEHLSGLIEPDRRTVLAGSAATRTAILDQLGAHTWVHAACHGYQDLADPATGGLLPYNWRTAGLVQVLDLAAARHGGGEFVFLSACKSAVGGIAMLDEAITLTAALHHAGWRHVVGTLWSVWDTAAADISRDTYARLAAGGSLDPSAAAEALHHAVRGFRQRNRRRPSGWAPFVHVGP